MYVFRNDHVNSSYKYTVLLKVQAQFFVFFKLFSNPVSAELSQVLIPLPLSAASFQRARVRQHSLC